MRLLIDRFVGLLWAFFTAIALVFAIVITIFRLALPAIDQQRPAIELWLSEFIGLPLHISEVSASWRGWMPTIDVEELVLMAADGNSELVRFDSAEIDISIAGSLRQLSFKPRRLIVRGMRIALERGVDGRISIAGMPPSRWPVTQWILQQENFVLTEAEVSFADRSAGTPTVYFDDVMFAVSHDDERQLIRGRLRRQNSADEEYIFALRASGDVLGPHWSGSLFVEVTNAEPGSVLALAGSSIGNYAAGRFHSRVWSTWENAKLHGAAIEIDGTAMQVSDGLAQSIADVDARGVALRLDDGWSLDFDRLHLKFPDEPLAESRLAVRWRARDATAPLIAFSADNLGLRDVARLLGVSGSASDMIPAGLREVAIDGVLNDLAGGVRHEVTAAPRYYVEGKVADLAVGETPHFPRFHGIDCSFRINNRGGLVNTDYSDGISVASEALLAAPIEIEEISGAVGWSLTPDELVIQSDLLRLRAESIDLTARGNLSLKANESPRINLVAQINSGELARLGSLIPLGKFPARGDAWLRTAFKAGHFEPSQIVLQGKLSDFPFDNGDGVFKGNFEVRGVDLKYGEKWPITTAIDATISVENRRMKTLVHEGQVYNAKIGSSIIEMPDLFSHQPIVRIQGKTRVAPDELGKFIVASPLGKTKARRYADVTISNDFDMTLDMNLSLYAGGETEVLGLVHFSGNRISHEMQQVTLEDVTGDISFTRQDWYGEGLTAKFDGDRVGVVLNGGLDDPNYDTEVRMTGTSEAPHLLRYIERYAPLLGSLLKSAGKASSLEGKIPWKAVMTIPESTGDGTTAPKRLSIESSLIGLDIDLPWPFGKTSSEKKPLAITTETSAIGDRLIRVDYAETVAIEFDQTIRPAGGFTTRRAEFVFGETSPTFSADPGLRARGTIRRLPLNDWAGFARTAAEAMVGAPAEMPISFDVFIDNLEAFGHTFEATKLTGSKKTGEWNIAVAGPQALGTITIPRDSSENRLMIDFERLWLRKSAAASTTSNVDPSRIPSLQLSADSLHFGDIDLGRATLVASHEAGGLKLDRLELNQPNFNLDGRGNWQLTGDVHQSQVTLGVKGKSLAGLLESFNYSVANIDGGKTDIEITAAWGGTPSEFTLDKLLGQFTLKVEKGRILDIEPGSGRLFGLLSLQTLPRRLSLDFNDLFSKGFTFDTIEGTFELDRGNAYTNSLLMNGPSARIDVSGRTGLADQDYDQLVTVTPALSNTIPVASALFGPAGIGVGAVIYLGQKMFKTIPEHVDRFLSREYSVTGGWKQPVIERI